MSCANCPSYRASKTISLVILLVLVFITRIEFLRNALVTGTFLSGKRAKHTSSQLIHLDVVAPLRCIHCSKRADGARANNHYLSFPVHVSSEEFQFQFPLERKACETQVCSEFIGKWYLGAYTIKDVMPPPVFLRAIHGYPTSASGKFTQGWRVIDVFYHSAVRFQVVGQTYTRMPKTDIFAYSMSDVTQRTSALAVF